MKFRTPTPNEAEQEALFALVDAFAKAMKSKLLAKLEEDKHGWDHDDWDNNMIRESLLAHVEKEKWRSAYHIDEWNLVDIANIAMFLWNRKD